MWIIIFQTSLQMIPKSQGHSNSWYLFLSFQTMLWLAGNVCTFLVPHITVYLTGASLLLTPMKCFMMNKKFYVPIPPVILSEYFVNAERLDIHFLMLLIWHKYRFCLFVWLVHGTRVHYSYLVLLINCAWVGTSKLARAPYLSNYHIVVETQG